MENSEDPDQMTSSEASLSGSTMVDILFMKKYYLFGERQNGPNGLSNPYQLDEDFNLHFDITSC